MSLVALVCCIALANSAKGISRNLPYFNFGVLFSSQPFNLNKCGIKSLLITVNISLTLFSTSILSIEVFVPSIPSAISPANKHKSISFFKRSMIAVIAVILLDDADIKLKSNNLPP